jgi:hypothetical protein
MSTCANPQALNILALTDFIWWPICFPHFMASSKLHSIGMNFYTQLLAHLGFLHLEADYTIFIFNHINGKGVRIRCVIAWHVDNGLTGSNNHGFLDKMKVQTAEQFSITDLGPITEYLSIQFIHDRQSHELWMHQEIILHTY